MIYLEQRLELICQKIYKKKIFDNEFWVSVLGGWGGNLIKALNINIKKFT